MQERGRDMILPRIATFLAVLLVARCLVHVAFLPPFEGPDEVFHLARIRAVATGEPPRYVGRAVIAAVHGVPCGADLGRSFGCVPFGPGRAASWTILKSLGLTSPDAGRTAPRFDNYEIQQPPLYYASVAMAFRVMGIEGASPFLQLFALRLISTLFVLAGLLVLRIVPAPVELKCLGLLLLMVPGSAEGLIRGSNDAMLFAWAALACAGVLRRWPSPVLVLLCGIGPFIKYTAFAVVAMMVVWLWCSRRRGMALAAFCASATVAAVATVRGWGGGATYQFERLAELTDGAWGIAHGLARSSYGLLKTSVWLGGWVGFRPHGIVLALVAASVLLPLLGLRFESQRALWWHGAGVFVAIAGFVVIAVGNRLVFGLWGGIGGWYLWNWAPWFWQGIVELARPARQRIATTLAAEGAVVLLLNILWWREAIAAYG